MRSAGEVSHGQVSSHASSYCILLSSGPCGLMRGLEPEHLMALFEGCILCITMGGLLACQFSIPVLKCFISGDVKVSWNLIQVPGDWLRNDGQGGTSGMLKCSVLPPQALLINLLINPATSIYKTSYCFLSLLLLECCFKALLSDG